MWTPRVFQKHPRIFAGVTFLLIFLPSYIDTLLSLYERIKGYIPKISLQWFSVNHLYVVTIPVGLYFLKAIWAQTKRPTSPAVKKTTSPEKVSDLGKALLRMLAVTVTNKVQHPNEDELVRITKLDALMVRVELRKLRREGFLYEGYHDQIHLSDDGEDYIHNELSEFSDKDIAEVLGRLRKGNHH